MLPDRYLEMQNYGFVRNSRGPRNASEIRILCVRPDGIAIHGASFNRETDTTSVVFLFERILTSFSQHDDARAAKHAGVLSHFIGDTLSPPHADADTCEPRIHAIIERSLASFKLEPRPPHATGERLITAITAVIDRCYEGAARNRRELAAMIEAARAGDDRALDPNRLRAGKEAAGILADALQSLCESRP
jgi:hypothetical protein